MAGEVYSREDIKEEVREELHSAGVHNLEHLKSMWEQECVV